MHAAIDNEVAIVMAVKATSPFKPSVRLIALVTPTVTSNVRAIPAGAIANKSSIFGIPVMLAQEE